jgi:hypothetical protein
LTVFTLVVSLKTNFIVCFIAVLSAIFIHIVMTTLNILYDDKKDDGPLAV